ncbi:MAG: adenylate/guanylate cyclase domain-containing protein [Rubrivivax sp.]|nr:adenylate/guanylate cyclase domain-containing protein [Rubrivivax sp.]
MGPAGRAVSRARTARQPAPTIAARTHAQAQVPVASRTGLTPPGCARCNDNEFNLSHRAATEEQRGSRSVHDNDNHNDHNFDIQSLRAAIAALEGQRATLGDSVLEMATAPLRARLSSLLRPAGLQHRQVTVLFADVVGATAMASGGDAEDTLGVLSGALRRMALLVEAHRGRVLRFTGDGVKAAFGMDEAREDDAERAVRAGLAILAAGREQADVAQRQHGIADFAVRVGVHTGDVALGAGVEADNTAMGVAVNIAARMEQTAAAGTMRISRDTWSQVRGLFDLEAQPPLFVKGIAAPMQTYLVRAALERSAASVERGLQGLVTPMVGRDAELQRLRDAVPSARATRRLQALTLLGDAGLGKSRLLREFTLGLTGCRLLTLRSQPDGMLRLFGLLRALLATQCGMADTDSAEVARRKVVEGLSPWFEERGERQAQLIGQLAGLDYADSPTVKGLDPRSLHDQAFAAVRSYLQALAAQGALPVLLVEDLHWADDGSLDLLQHLLAHAAELPLVLLMTARPALLARRPDWAAPATTVPLSPLVAADSDTLAAALLQRIAPLPAKLTELIVGRAEGNPYYMEELVRRLIDDGVIVAGDPHWTLQTDRYDTLRLPTTLVGLLQARLDALPAGERAAARQASIVGHVFWDDALQALDVTAPRALPALQRAAFVKARDTSDFEGTAERQFDHHLLHQVTYSTLLKAERRLGHGAAARWLAERTRGRGAEFLAMTGEHAERAGETSLAIDCFEQAAAEAQERFANTAAQAHCQRALSLLGESEPMRRVDLLNRLQRIAETVGDRPGQDTLLVEMHSLLERHPDDHRQARLLYSMAILAERRSDAAACERLARQCFDLAERCGAAHSAAMGQAHLAWLHIARHDYPTAASHIESGLSWAARIESDATRAEIEGTLLTLSGMVSMDTGQLHEAGRTLAAVLARGEALGKPRLQLGALASLATLAGILGRWEEVARWGEQAHALARAVGSPRDIAAGQLRLAEAAEALDDCVAAVRWHEDRLIVLRAIADRRMEAITLRFLARLHLAQGKAQKALACCAQSLALHQALEEELEACGVEAIAALCEVRQGRPAEALARVNATLGRLQQALAECPAIETLPARWTCQQVLEALGGEHDQRAGPLLEQLHADVQARATAVTDAADRDRLIQAIPDFRDIVAAYGRRRGPAFAGSASARH